MYEAILLCFLLKLPVAAVVLPLSSSPPPPPPPEPPSESCPNVGDMGEVGDIIMAAIEPACGPGDVGDKGGSAALAVALLLLLLVASLEDEAAGEGGGEK